MLTSSAPPQICPEPQSLDLLELVRLGAYRPTESGALYLPVSLPNPRDVAAVTLVDPEGVPLVQLPLEQSAAGPRAQLLDLPKWMGSLSSRPFEELYKTPAEVRASIERDTVTVLADHPLDEVSLRQFEPATSLVLIVLAGPSTSPSAGTLATLRSARALADRRPRTQVVAMPMAASHARTDPNLYTAVLEAYAPHGHLVLPPANEPENADGGLVLFFTGLSGSGKSTVARAVRNAVLERYDRAVSLLDGDVVRHQLSAGLGFSAQDRATNIRRIGWVAAQIAYHRGFAICSPIAPYRSTRQEVRELVEQLGGQFVLVYVSTPMEVCEARDRKGLYARARAGAIEDFTGIGAPYEPPADADLVLDTATLTLEQARDRVLDVLATRGLLATPGWAES